MVTVIGFHYLKILFNAFLMVTIMGNIYKAGGNPELTWVGTLKKIF
jgi:hypothetical protein